MNISVMLLGVYFNLYNKVVEQLEKNPTKMLIILGTIQIIMLVAMSYVARQVLPVCIDLAKSTIKTILGGIL